MKYIFMISAIIASYHAYTFAKWLKEGGNRKAMLAVYLFILICLGLPIYSWGSSL